MDEKSIIKHTIVFVKKTLQHAEGGHDWFHVERVYKNSLAIAKNQTVDVLVVSLGALLHDIADSKFHNGDETLGPKLATDFLESLNVEQQVIEHVVNIIKNISFKSGLPNKKTKSKPFKSLELDVVQDADRLDAMGAIGIARAFNYGGFKNRMLYHPDIKPLEHISQSAYKNSQSPTINHFYEKLLLLKDRMNTLSGKQLAEQRHKFMQQFLEQFYNEWNGKV